jgi:hypothetical protein
MNLQKFLTDNHRGICAEWTDAIFKTYPEEGQKFFSNSSNQFSNPVGHTFRNNIEKIYLALVRGADLSECSTDLDGILRIRAVQGFAPSVALSFLPALKEIVHREVTKAKLAEAFGVEMHDWEMRIDYLTMMGFDLYMSCRETLWKQKANQLYSRTHKLLERSNLIQDEEVAG